MGMTDDAGAKLGDGEEGINRQTDEGRSQSLLQPAAWHNRVSERVRGCQNQVASGVSRITFFPPPPIWSRYLQRKFDPTYVGCYHGPHAFKIHSKLALSVHSQ